MKKEKRPRLYIEGEKMTDPCWECGGEVIYHGSKGKNDPPMSCALCGEGYWDCKDSILSEEEITNKS